MENKERSSEKKQYDELFEDDEDEKMEKFYELIRRFNEARDNHQRSLLPNHNQRHRQAINHNHNSTRKKKNEDVNNKAMTVGSDGTTWMPSFRWEDFRDLNHDHHDHQVSVVSDKSATPINFLKNHSSNCVHTYDINKFDNNFKKRKTNDVADDDDDDNDVADDYDDEITTATQLNNQSSHQHFDTGLDLNLAL